MDTGTAIVLRYPMPSRFSLYVYLAGISVPLGSRESGALNIRSIPANARCLDLSVDECLTIKTKMLLIILRKYKIQF